MKTVVEVKDLVKRYKELVALDHFQLSIKEGEIFGLLGPNGSGKTTTIHCILGLLSYDKGEIQVFGKKMKSDAYEIKQDIGVVMQNVAIFLMCCINFIAAFICPVKTINTTCNKGKN